VSTLNLKRLLDVPLDQPIALTTPLAMPGPAELATATIDPAVLRATRASIQAQERQVAIRDQQVRIARSQFLPSADLSVTYGKQVMPARVFGLGGQDVLGNFTASIGVNVPIFNGFRRNAELQEARIQLEQERLRLGQLEETVQVQYAQALGEKQRAAADLAARARTVEQARRVYELTVLRYEKGLSTQLEVTDSRLSLLQARTNLAQAIAGFQLADAGIARATVPATAPRVSSPAVRAPAPAAATPTAP
jgi:outer membrane protein TolC